ncbi:MAG TPA: signal peptide peptidase SppA [Candidatus Dojkabacteria bacterium]|jgi:protease-4
MNSEKPRRRFPFIKISIILFLLLFLCICFIGSTYFVIKFIDTLQVGPYDETILSGNRNEQIAVVEINGVISSTPEAGGFFDPVQEDMVTRTIDKLEKTKNDDNIKAVILDINSPGGEVYGSELIALKIKEVKEKKPVIALMRDTAASGGYYIAAPANKIVASEITITGSIGVLIQTADIEGLYNKLGIQIYTVTNSEGDNKVLTGQDLGDPNSEGFTILRGVLDDTYDKFVETIVEGRGMTEAEVVALADGRIYSGRQALENGLVDEIGYMDKAIELAMEEADLAEPRVVIIAKEEEAHSIDEQIAKLISNTNEVVTGEAPGGKLKVFYLLPY